VSEWIAAKGIGLAEQGNQARYIHPAPRSRQSATGFAAAEELLTLRGRSFLRDAGDRHHYDPFHRLSLRPQESWRYG
jgi:hypothetical protein